jgi:hypothetical protein
MAASAAGTSPRRSPACSPRGWPPRDAFAAAVMAMRGHQPKTLATPLFALDAVMFHADRRPFQR